MHGMKFKIRNLAYFRSKMWKYQGMSKKFPFVIGSLEHCTLTQDAWQQFHYRVHHGHTITSTTIDINQLTDRLCRTKGNDNNGLRRRVSYSFFIFCSLFLLYLFFSPRTDHHSTVTTTISPTTMITTRGSRHDWYFHASILAPTTPTTTLTRQLATTILSGTTYDEWGLRLKLRKCINTVPVSLPLADFLLLLKSYLFL